MQRTAVTRTVENLYNLYKGEQLILQPEFQRNSVWPRKAKAYFIDTLLAGRPVPLLFFQRATSPRHGLVTYYVVDGQQRLRAIIEFLEDGFRLVESKGSAKGRYFSELAESAKRSILDHQLVIDELVGYSDTDTRDIFKRMNKYVVRANPQEIRHATKPGQFADFVVALSKLEFWSNHKLFTATQQTRMRDRELCAELVILLIEGPQDKKASVDLYYDTYSEAFPEARHIRKHLENCLAWIEKYIPEIEKTFLRKPTDLYSLVGALDRICRKQGQLPRPKSDALSERLKAFEAKLRAKPPRGEAARYAEAASRQTDNLRPRQTRIEIIEKLILATL
ncbi:MAG: DUF262 domain-containing protein [Burkholderiales bacterium]|nr:DUF262 domain-containing protein [Burkholderiales bacterium]